MKPTEKRAPSQTRARTTKKAFLQQLKQEYFLDILRASSHSKHFRHTRAQYISNRVRTIAFMLAVMIPAWIAVDTVYLPNQEMQSIAIMRLITGSACLLLSFWATESHSLYLSRLKLMLLVLIPSTFQTVAHLYLMQSDFNTLPAGYHFFPFLIITLSAIFPLTIYEGGTLAAFVAALYIGTAKYLGVLDLTETLNDIWLLMLLGLIAGWAALTQLTMLMRLYRQAHRDSLTGLANRRSITAYLKREVSYSHATKTPLSILLFDLDKFKRVNDSYGHAAGDEVLKVFSQLMIGQSRNEDLVGRYGGEEFLMILSNTNIEIAQKIGERLRLSCHDQQIESPSGEDLFNFTTSIGVAELTANESVTLLLKRVDDALYEAKGAGRDRLVVA